MSNSNNLVEKINKDRADLSRAFGLIADYLLKTPQGFIHAPMRELSTKIGVSEPTLIRFSRHYGYTGLPDFRLAIAMALAAGGLNDGADLEPRLADKEGVNRLAKQAIAAAAVSVMAKDKAILLDSGSTVQFLATELRNAPALTIMSTGLKSALGLMNSPQHQLMLPGGEIRKNALSLSGRLAETSLSAMRFDTAYIGADSIDAEHGLSTFNEAEAHLTRAMIAASQRTVVLADATKFKSPALHKICALSKVDIIITDQNLTPEICREVRALNVQLILAKLPVLEKSQRERP